MTLDELDGHVRGARIGNFVANAIINGALAWWLLGHHEQLHAWSDPAYGPDLILTGFLLSAIVAAIVIQTHRRKARRGDLTAAPLGSPILEDATRRSVVANALLAGGVGAAASGLLAIACTGFVGSLGALDYTALKALWTGMLAATIVEPGMRLGLHVGAAERAAA